MLFVSTRIHEGELSCIVHLVNDFFLPPPRVFFTKNEKIKAFASSKYVSISHFWVCMRVIQESPLYSWMILWISLWNKRGIWLSIENYVYASGVCKRFFFFFFNRGNWYNLDKSGILCVNMVCSCKTRVFHPERPLSVSALRRKSRFFNRENLDFPLNADALMVCSCKTRVFHPEQLVTLLALSHWWASSIN